MRDNNFPCYHLTSCYKFHQESNAWFFLQRCKQFLLGGIYNRKSDGSKENCCLSFCKSFFSSLMSDYLCWPVLYSPTGNMNLLSEATLFVATKRTPPRGKSLVSSYQALLGIIQNEVPKEKILFFDEGKEVPFKEVSLTKNFVTAMGESFNLFAAFRTDSEAKVCSQSVELLARGDLFEFKVLSSGNMLKEEKVKEVNLEEQVLSILHDPGFPELVKEVGSLLFQHPTELASIMETLSVM